MDRSPRRAEIGAFLRRKRETIKPQDVGIVGIGRRRTPGLRREEVAQLSSVSVTWYTWLETGRDVNASSETFNRVSEALRLSPDECAYLRQLASADASPAPDLVPESVQELLGDFRTSAAYLTNARLDILAVNERAVQLLGVSIGANLVEQMFLDTDMRSLLADGRKSRVRPSRCCESAMHGLWRILISMPSLPISGIEATSSLLAGRIVAYRISRPSDSTRASPSTIRLPGASQVE